MEWSDGSIEILTKIRLNSVLLNTYYKRQHIKYHEKIKWFKLPLIILNSISATASVGLAGYGIQQSIINGIICGIGITNGIISAVELQLGIDRQAESALIASKDFYILACDILKILSLEPHERGCDSIVFLNDMYSRYIELIKNNDIVEKHIADQLLNVSSTNGTVTKPITTPRPSPTLTPNSMAPSNKLSSFSSENFALEINEGCGAFIEV